MLFGKKKKGAWEELKENISQQIKVRKLRDGSQITIETDM